MAFHVFVMDVELSDYEKTDILKLCQAKSIDRISTKEENYHYIKEIITFTDDRLTHSNTNIYFVEEANDLLMFKIKYTKNLFYLFYDDKNFRDKIFYLFNLITSFEEMGKYVLFFEKSYDIYDEYYSILFNKQTNFLVFKNSIRFGKIYNDEKNDLKNNLKHALAQISI
jgi:hypothetical protein